MSAERDQFGAIAVGEPPEMADTHEASWEYVQEKTPDEFVRGERHLAFLVAVGIVLPAECDPVIFKAQ